MLQFKVAPTVKLQVLVLEVTLLQLPRTASGASGATGSASDTLKVFPSPPLASLMGVPEGRRRGLWGQWGSSSGDFGEWH